MSEMPSITPAYADIISKVLQSYKDKYGLDLNYMKFIEDPTPRFNNGKKVPETLGIVPGGSWTKHKKIYLAPDMQPAMKAYGVTEDKNKFIARIIAHELGHEVYNNSPWKDRLRKMIAAKIAEDNFNTAYLDSVKPDRMEEEAFAEYLANNLVSDL